jgi:hypothetical protein
VLLEHIGEHREHCHAPSLGVPAPNSYEPEPGMQRQDMPASSQALK